ncbi:MAG: FAD-dependent tricarballylate dehydrogenase TcuA [Gammaproteobacteria bacterium]|nr:FAD-dependent tricarballylate dehydrogenase TcuA [Gammaproteobacteria bacterium]
MGAKADYDVVVVGAGNAALAAALSAREHGAERVVVLEKAPHEMRGGNTHWSGGLFRIAYGDVSRLEPLVPDAEQEVPGFNAGVEPYGEEDFHADLMRVTGGRSDPTLAKILIGESYDAVRWVHEAAGVAMEPAFSLGGIRVGNVVKWPKGAVIRARGEGVGLSSAWFLRMERSGVEVRYGCAASGLVRDRRGHVVGVTVRTESGLEDVGARSVVLACGGFEANVQWRAQYLGRPWDHAKVRGTPHNQGDGLRMALDIGAMPWGQWSGCHSTPISNEWADFAERKLTDKSNRLSYPFGVMINRKGLRFVDEGEDVQFFTYAKYGGIILSQPGSLAWQIFDQKTVHLLEGRYKTSVPIQSDTLAGLVEQLDVDDREQALATLESYNAAACEPEGFDPSRKDGLATSGLEPPKSNWALRLDEPPFVAYSATGGITFTFGGLKIDEQARVIATDWRPIPGLYTCGEMVGGLFHGNYPGGSGLVSGAVFGRIAGREAARYAA